MSESEFYMRISAFGLTPDQQAALFDRVAEAAHALDEQVSCAQLHRDDDLMKAEIDGLRASLMEVTRQNDDLLERLDEIHRMARRRN